MGKIDAGARFQEMRSKEWGRVEGSWFLLLREVWILAKLVDERIPTYLNSFINK